MTCGKILPLRYSGHLVWQLGIIFSFLAPGFTPDLSSFLFGNILTINRSDITLLAILSVALILFFTLFLRPITAIAFDREFARSQRIPVAAFEYTLMAFIALTIVACLRMVGIVLAISLLTLPQMTANLFTYSFKRIIWLSVGIGYIGCLGGLLLSYQLRVPSGGSNHIYLNFNLRGSQVDLHATQKSGSLRISESS